jgi:tetratricopeptide (TPR) repeat protein
LASATRLFHERASMCDRNFTLSPPVVAAVEQICRRLDGVPLAIELAASRVGTASVFEIRDEISRNFAFLSSNNRELPLRQHISVESDGRSRSDLEPDERRMLARLAVFRQAFTLSAADAVARDDCDGRTPTAVLASLVEKSVVLVDWSTATPLYRLSTRMREPLDDGETASVVRASSASRHARWIGKVADTAGAKYLRVPHGSWMSEAAPWLDDARAAISWALSDGRDPVLAGRILGGLRGVWRAHGRASECRRWVETVLPLIDAREHPALVSQLYRALAQSSTGLKRVKAALRARKLAETSDDRVAMAASTTMLTEGLYEVGRYERALELVDRNARLIESEGLRASLLFGRTFYDRSLILRALGEGERITPELDQALRIASLTGDEWVSLDCQTISADLAYDTGAATSAIALAEEILRHSIVLGWDVFAVSSLNSLATYQLGIERIDDALSSATRALELARGRDPFGFDLALQHLAELAARRGRFSEAAILYGFVRASFERKAHIQPERDRTPQIATLSGLQEQLDPSKFSALSHVGQTLTEDVAADLALSTAGA